MKNIDTLESILERFRDETGRYIVDSIFLRQALNLYIEDRERLARIDELEQLLGRQWWADDQHHEDEVVPYHHIEAQIKQLSNNLSKGDV